MSNEEAECGVCGGVGKRRSERTFDEERGMSLGGRLGTSSGLGGGVGTRATLATSRGMPAGVSLRATAAAAALLSTYLENTS